MWLVRYFSLFTSNRCHFIYLQVAIGTQWYSGPWFYLGDIIWYVTYRQRFWEYGVLGYNSLSHSGSVVDYVWASYLAVGPPYSMPCQIYIGSSKVGGVPYQFALKYSLLSATGTLFIGRILLNATWCIETEYCEWENSDNLARRTSGLYCQIFWYACRCPLVFARSVNSSAYLSRDPDVATQLHGLNTYWTRPT